MMVKIGKNKMAVGLAFMITLASSKAYAFGIPLLSADMKRLIDSAQMIMQQVSIIKQEIDSNLAIIQEIQNGGFASAGAMIFDKIQNGDYDRFGNALSSVKSESQDMAANVKARKQFKEEEQAALAQGMTEEQARAVAQQKMAEKLQKDKKEREQAKAIRKAARGENAFDKSYNWLKSNSGVTSGASDALRGVSNGNWGQVVSGAVGATGSSINSGGENSVGNIFNNASSGAGSALNSALSGDWSGALSNAAHGTGSAVGGATGSQGLGTAIGGLGDFGAGVADAAAQGGNIGDIINNNRVNSGISGMTGGYGQMQDEKKAAEEAQKEALKKQAEEIKNKNDELFKQLKQQQCNDCMKKNGGSAAGCMTYCS